MLSCETWDVQVATSHDVTSPANPPPPPPKKKKKTQVVKPKYQEAAKLVSPGLVEASGLVDQYPYDHKGTLLGVGYFTRNPEPKKKGKGYHWATKHGFGLGVHKLLTAHAPPARGHKGARRVSAAHARTCSSGGRCTWARGSLNPKP